jgi:hypothetical protein
MKPLAKPIFNLNYGSNEDLKKGLLDRLCE